jgi:hypothetical protein
MRKFVCFVLASLMALAINLATTSDASAYRVVYVRTPHGVLRVIVAGPPRVVRRYVRRSHGGSYRSGGSSGHWDGYAGGRRVIGVGATGAPCAIPTTPGCF